MSDTKTFLIRALNPYHGGKETIITHPNEMRSKLHGESKTSRCHNWFEVKVGERLAQQKQDDTTQGLFGRAEYLPGVGGMFKNMNELSLPKNRRVTIDDVNDDWFFDEFDLLKGFCFVGIEIKFAVAIGTVCEFEFAYLVDHFWRKWFSQMLWVTGLCTAFALLLVLWRFWRFGFENIGGGWLGGITGVLFWRSDFDFESFDLIESGL